MEAIGLLVTLEARPGKEDDAAAFLKSAQRLALNENGTLKWYGFKLGLRKFGIFLPSAAISLESRRDLRQERCETHLHQTPASINRCSIARKQQGEIKCHAPPMHMDTLSR
jgi:hypothetical protein